jgi:MFS family permease
MLVSSGVAVLGFNSHLSPQVLIVTSFLLGACYAFAKPAVGAILPSLVSSSNLPNAMAVNTLQFTLGQVVGSAMSAVILASFDSWVAFAANAVTFFGPIVAMLVLRDVVVQEISPSSVNLRAMLNGLRSLVRGSKLLGIVGGIVLANSMVESVRTLAPVMTSELTTKASQAGLLVGGIGAGTAVGALAFGWLASRVGRHRMLQWGFIVQGGGLLATVAAASMEFALVAAFCNGLGFSATIPLLSAVMQERTPEAFRGRVMALFVMAHLGLRPITALGAGALANILSVRAALAVFVLSAVIALGALSAGKLDLGRSGSSSAAGLKLDPLGDPD